MKDAETMTVPEFLPYNESGCARFEVYYRPRRFRDPIYRSRIAPIHVPGLSKPLRVSVCMATSSFSLPVELQNESLLQDQSSSSSSLVHANSTAAVVPTSRSFSSAGGRKPNVSAKTPFNISDSASNNFAMALRFRQLPELAKQRLRVNKSLIHGWGIFVIEVR
jgi:hypothetical protein